MPVNDLNGKGAVAAEADFVVVGAGTVGLLTAVLLARKTGKRVVCLETGGASQDADTHPQNAVVQSGWHYRGAADGRFRCLGGTSTRWGGAMIPFQDADLQGAGWPISAAELAPFVAEVEALFGLESGPYDDPAFPFDLGANQINRLAKWPSFGKRNVASLLHDDIQGESVQVWLNAHVVEIATDPDGVSLTAASPAGDRMTVRGGKLIIAAGAIETTRLALLLERSSGTALSPVLGRFFSDHLSVDVAEIANPKLAQLSRILGFRFSPGGSMRNIRFELTPTSDARHRLPPSFCHFSLLSIRPGGFEALREVFRSIQQRRLPGPSVLLDLVRNAPWLARAVWWRFVYKRVLYPPQARVVVNVVVEQSAERDSRIGLAGDAVDSFGQPLADLNWLVTPKDEQATLATAALFRETWNNSDFRQLGEWQSYDDAKIIAGIEECGGIYHPTGSTRMGTDASTGVVDKNLCLFGQPNIQLLATSVLPTGGGANPTMMLILLAMRCVGQHAEADCS